MIRTRKVSNLARGTYFLETAERGTSQDTERIEPRDGPLTPWRRQREGCVRTRKGSSRERDSRSGDGRKTDVSVMEECAVRGLLTL